MLRRSRIVAVLVFAPLLLRADDKAARASAIFQRAREVMFLEDPTAPMYAAGFAFITYADADTSFEGTAERLWKSPDSWLENYSGKQFRVTRIFSGETAKQARDGDLPPGFNSLSRALAAPILRLDRDDKVKRVEERTEQGAALVCIIGRRFNYGTERCFDKSSGVLMSDKTNFFAITYDGYLDVQGKKLPRVRRVYTRQIDRFIVSAKLTLAAEAELSSLGPLRRDPTTASLPAYEHAAEYKPCYDVVRPPESLNVRMPRRFLSRNRNRVTVRFTINEKGRVDEARVLKSTDPRSDKDAVAIVRTWTFVPSRCGREAMPAAITVTLGM